MIRSVDVPEINLRGVEVKVVQPRQGIMQEISYGVVLFNGLLGGFREGPKRRKDAA